MGDLSDNQFKNRADKLIASYLCQLPITYQIDTAKQCALIAVNEILHVLHENSRCMESRPSLEVIQLDMMYWNEVKKEIEKL